jgi:hypothetical protein
VVTLDVLTSTGFMGGLLEGGYGGSVLTPDQFGQALS